MYEIPYQGCDGFSRYRCFPAEGKQVVKYLQPKDTGNHLYVPGAVAPLLSDPTMTLYLTEGEKKALKANQEGIACIGLGGLWNYKDKEKGLIPDFDKVSWSGRAVHIIPDNDWLLPNRHGYKKNLEQAVHELAYELIDRGAKVSVILLPEGQDKGIDDYLISHSVDDFLALPTKQIRKLTLEESVADVSLDTLDAVLKRIAKIPSQVKQEALVADIAKALKVSKSAIKRELKRHGAKLDNDQGDNNGKPMTALFSGLVDLVEADGKTAFLIKDTSGLRIETIVDIDGVQYIPPSKDHLPFLLPRAEQCLSHYQVDDRLLFNDLLSYLRRFSYLPPEQWAILGLYIFSTYLQDHQDISYQAMILFHAVPERGKSRTGKAMGNVSFRGVHVVDMRETNIFRFSGNLGATIFFDIMDLWKKAERNGSEDVLLLRYERGAKVPRVLYPEKGAFKDTVHFPIHGPTIMASNAEVHKILGSRCLTFSMPNAPGNYENPTPELALDMKERLVAWRAKMIDRPLPDIHPIDGITGRLWDITMPLFKICQAVCPERYEALADAVLNIAGERVQEKKETSDGLLIQVIYEMTQTDATHFDILTSEVTTRFNELWNGDKAKSDKWTGRRLKAIGVPTDTKTGYSTIRLNRETLDTLLVQYGFISQGGEINSNNSRNSKAVDITSTLGFEFPFSENKETPETPETQRNSKINIPIISSGIELPEFSEVIPGGVSNKNVKDNLREVRL